MRSHRLLILFVCGLLVALTLGPPKNPVYDHDAPDDRVRAF